MTERFAALIRHGEYHQRKGAPSALQPFPLTEKGEAQARACGVQIAGLLDERGWRLDPVIHASCQLRAWQTARLAADVLAASGHEILEIHQTPALSERSMGSAANLTVEEIETVLRTDPRFDPAPTGWKSDRDYCLPLQGAESMAMAGKRVAGHLRETLAQTADGMLTLFFGHGASFRHAAHELGVLARNQIAAVSMYHARPLRLCYTGNDRWAHCGGSWKPRRGDLAAMD